MEYSTLSGYIQATLGSRPTIRPWAGQDQLKLYLRGRYEFAEMQLLHTTCLLARVRDAGEVTPATLTKDREALCDESGYPVVFWLEEIASYDRTRLVERKLCFVVPDRQLYLPHLGINFLEYFKRRNQTKFRPHTFPPSTQVIALALLQNPALHQNRPVPLSMVTERVVVPLEGGDGKQAYSKQSVSRAFDHLIATGVFYEERRGAERFINFDLTPPGLWHELEQRFRSPVQTRYSRRHVSGFTAPASGITALAQRTSIGQPDRPSFAVRKIEPFEPYLEFNPPDDPQSMELEVWRYEPAAVLGRANPWAPAPHPGIDNLSLYLSLRDHEDERVQGALEELLEQTFA